MPRLDALYRKYRSAGLSFVALSAEPSSALLRRFFRSSGFSMPAACLIGPGMRAGLTLPGEQLRPMSTFLIGPDRRIAFRGVQVDHDRLLAELNAVGIRERKRESGKRQ